MPFDLPRSHMGACLPWLLSPGPLPCTFSIHGMAPGGFFGVQGIRGRGGRGGRIEIPQLECRAHNIIVV